MIFRLAFLLLCCLCPQLLPAQGKQYNIVNYNTDNGLPQNSITSIQFDRKGYCWLGTQMGLVRFDGQRFSVFGSDNIKGLRSDRIYNTTRDTAGAVFICTGGIVNVLKIDDRSSMSAPEPVLLSAPEPYIPMQGFAVPHGYMDTITTVTAVQMTFGTAKGNLYLIQTGDSYYITPYKKIPIAFKGPYERNRILLAGESLVVFRSHTKVAVWTYGMKRPQPKLRGSLWTDPEFIKGNFIIPVNTDGAYVYAGSTLYQLSLVHDTLYSKTLLDGVKIPAVFSIYVDKANHTFYIGSAVSGLFIVRPTDFYTPPTPGADMNASLYSQAVTEEGIFSARFLFRKDGTVKEYPLIPHNKSIWYRPGTRSLFYAPDLALLRFDVATGKTYTIAPLATRLSSIFPDPGRKEDIIFTTGFSVGKISHDTLTEEKTIPGLTEGQDLFVACPAGPDTFLLATRSGVKWYDYRHNTVYRSILDSLTVRQLHIESPQRIWIASYGKGWYCYDSGRIIRLPDGPRAALKTVNAIIDDGRGYFWLSSNNGLFKVSRQALIDYSERRSEEVYFYAFTTSDHLPTNEFNACNPSYVWLSDSMLSLPSIKGLVWFYPHQVQLSLPDRGIYLESIHIDQAAIAPTPDRLVLPPDHSRLSLKVSSPYFGNKENMRLQFKMEGLDEEWHEIPESGDIIIDRMPAGTYSLVVRKITGIKPGQYTYLKLPIRVQPYWYNTRLFYVVFLFFFIACVYWIVKLRTRLLQARNRKLKTQVALQTRDLNRMVHQLTQSEEALKQSNQTKDNIITTVLHDLRSPIRFIYTISKHIATGYQTMQQAALGVHLQELKNSTASLNSFTDQFFTWALSQHRAFSAKYSPEALANLFRETESLYTDILGANGNQLIVLPTELYCYTDPQLLATVLRNLLDNANKNTRNGIIKLSAAQVDNNVIITVSDTGSGFTPEALKVFLNKEKTDTRGGNGSFIILHLLELIGGQLEADSAPGKGTAFRITLFHQNSIHDNRPAG